MSAETVFELRAEIDQLRDAINRQDREVERLQAELDRRDNAAAEALADQTMMRSLTVKDGAINLGLIPPREIAMRLVECARGMLGDAENYTETPVKMPTVSMEVKLAGEVERYALIVQRVGKLTPHEARQQAEARAEAAEAEVARLAAQVQLLGSHLQRGALDAVDAVRAEVAAEPVRVVPKAFCVETEESIGATLLRILPGDGPEVMVGLDDNMRGLLIEMLARAEAAQEVGGRA